MKKIILLLSLVGVFSFATAQRGAHDQTPQKLFDEGKEMFLEENYTGAYDILSEYLNQGKDAHLIEQAEYFMAASTYYRNTPNSGDILKEFLEKHPETAYNHHIKFMIGSFHFNEKDWSKHSFG